MSENQLKQQHEFNKLHKRLRRQVGQAIADYDMIQDGDKVMVCLSGGKDSYTMLDILINLRDHAPINFELIAVNLDQKQPGFPEHVLPEYLKKSVCLFILSKKIPIALSKRLYRRAKRLVVFVPDFAEVRYMVMQDNMASPKSP